MSDHAPNIEPGPGRLVYDNARRTIVAVPAKARPLSEWHDDMGPVLWWSFPIEEEPYVGTPNDLGRSAEIEFRISCEEPKLFKFDVGGWPGYHTHWTPLPPAPSLPD